MKICQKKFGFLDNYSWICCGNFSVLRQEYLSSGVNKKYFPTQLISELQKNRMKVLSFRFRAAVQIIWELQPRWLSKSVLKQYLLDI